MPAILLGRASAAPGPAAPSADRAHRRPEEGLPQAAKDDSRVTRRGNFLRRASLDELPQLLNGLRGETDTRPSLVAGRR